MAKTEHTSVTGVTLDKLLPVFGRWSSKAKLFLKHTLDPPFREQGFDPLSAHYEDVAVRSLSDMMNRVV
jgi:hypothetical protein